MTKQFDIRFNGTGITQAFFSGAFDRVVFRPNAFVDVTHIRGGSGILTKVDSFINEIKRRGIKKFYLQRSFAFGDVLMVVPVVRYLEQLGYEVYIRTSESFHDVLSRLDINWQYSPASCSDDLYGLNLDYTVERDHVERRLQSFHRVELFFDAVGIQNVESVDWSYDVNNFNEIDDDFLSEDYIVFQGQGSTQTKGLPVQTIRYIIKQLNNAGVRIVYIGRRGPKIDTDMTKFYFTKLSKSDLFPLISRAKAVIGMDSSPLWISHYTKTPYIGIFGPTRPEQRINLHPLYPDHVGTVELNDLIDCEHCFETAKKCGRRFDCFRADPKKIYKLILSELEKKVWENC